MSNPKEKELQEKPARLWLAMGEAYLLLGQPESARSSFREAVTAAERGSRDMLEAYYGLLAAMEGNPQLAIARLDCCREALEVFPLDIQLLLAMGNQLLLGNHLDLAIRSFAAAVQHGEPTPDVWHPIAVRETAATCLGLALQAAGRDLEACQALQEAVADHPDSLSLKTHLLNLYAKLGKTEQAIALADAMPCDDGRREPFRDAIRGACKAAQQEWTAALGYLQAAYLSGCDSAFCLRWLAVTLLSNGEVEATRPVLAQWQSVEPDNAELLTYLNAVAQLDQDAAATQGNTQELPVRRPGNQHLRIDRKEDAADGVPPPANVVSQNTFEVHRSHP